MPETDSAPKQQTDSIVESIWNLLKSMKFAIVLLLVITAATIFNLFANEFIIPVRGGAVVAKSAYIEAYGTFRGNLLAFLQMYSPYRSWWYTILLALLLFSLLVCVIDRASTVWRLAFKPRLPESDDAISVFKNHTQLNGKSTLAGLERTLRKRQFLVRKRSDENVVLVEAVKHSIAHTGSWFVHIGFVLLVIGGAMIARGGSSISVQGLPGDLLGASGYASVWGFDVRVDRFTIEYHPLNERQYVSVDSIKIGRTLKKNEDNTYDIELFSPTRGKLENVAAERISNQIKQKMQGGRLDQANIADYLATLTIIENGQELRTETIEVNKPLRHRGYRFYQSSFNDNRTDAEGNWTTIINVRKDSGAPFVWAGIWIVSIGLFLGMYMVPRRIVARIIEENGVTHITIGGKSNRNQTLFEEEFEQIIKQLND